MFSVHWTSKSLRPAQKNHDFKFNKDSENEILYNISEKTQT